MKKRISAWLTVALLAGAAGSGLAQELPPGTERAPVPVPNELPAAPAPVATPAPVVAPALLPEAGCCPNRVLWMEHLVPVHTLAPREIITEERRPTLEVAYRDEKQVVTELVVHTREVEKLVPCTVLKPVTQTCPETGQCTTVLEPCTEMKVVKETEYYSVPEQKTIVVPVPYLRPAELIVPRKAIALEYHTAFNKTEEPIVIPGHEVPPTRYVMPPEPPHPDCH
jgi:hypothetical protein